MNQRRSYHLSFTQGDRKLIIGEGESDRAFFAAYCNKNRISGFQYAYVGMNQENDIGSGFGSFGRYLKVISQLSGFGNLSDIIIACDAGQDQKKTLRNLEKQVRTANKAIGKKVFAEDLTENVPATVGVPRVHVLMVPCDKPGGMETLCCHVLISRLEELGYPGKTIEGWVTAFADNACFKWKDGQPWTVEKRDKLRLQATISAAWPAKPESNIIQLLDLRADNLIPLDSPEFGHIGTFLGQVEALQGI